LKNPLNKHWQERFKPNEKVFIYYFFE